MGEDILVYIAGPYTGNTNDRLDNVAVAERIAQQLLFVGYAVYCPHSMMHGWEQEPSLEYDDFMQCEMVILERCDAVFVCPNWQESKGACQEVERAEELGIPVVETMIDLLRKCPIMGHQLTKAQLDWARDQIKASAEGD